MATVSPPKPWERASNRSQAATPSASLPAAATPSVNATNTTAATANQPPELPSKPSSLSTVVNRTAANYSPYSTANRYGTGAYGASPYNTYSSYSSPYNRFGSGYGSMYGSGMYGGGMYGGGMYGGMSGGMMGMGMGMDPNDPNSLTNSFSQSTQATFSMIENLVGAFGGVAQMLESTYMATRSSFFAIISVAEQFSNLRTTLGSILGIFTLMRWLRTLLAKLTGRPPPADATALTPSAFASFQGLSPSTPATLPNGQPVPSKKPFLFFLAAVIGLPYIMTKIVRGLVAQTQQQENQAQQEGQLLLGPDGQPLPEQYQTAQRKAFPIDPSQLEFCRVLYDYPPSNHPRMDNSMDLSVKANDLVAVLSRDDPAGNPSEWWQCRTRDHQVGYLPAVYLKPFVKKPVEMIEEGQGHSRVNTISSVIGGGKDESRSNSLNVGKAKAKEEVYK